MQWLLGQLYHLLVCAPAKFLLFDLVSSPLKGGKGSLWHSMGTHFITYVEYSHHSMEWSCLCFRSLSYMLNIKAVSSIMNHIYSVILAAYN